MARVTGPLHSDSASGTIGTSLTFAAWKGRAYVRGYTTPSNPQSAKQTGVRSMWGFLATLWAGLSDVTKATWDDLASATSISAFNAYVSVNMKNWQSLLAPSQAYPAARTSTGLTLTTQTTTGGAGEATVSLTPSAATDLWGFILYRDTATGFTPSWTNAVAVIEGDGASAVTYSDTPLDAGTYYYRAVPFNTDGTMGTIHAETSAIVS